MEEFGMALLAVLILKFTDFLKNVKAGAEGKGWNGAVTQVIVWAAALGGVFLMSASDFGVTKIPILDIALNDADGATKLLLGLMGGSLASVVYDAKKAVDNTDSAAQPPLIKS
jgi:hypothetical protein